MFMKLVAIIALLAFVAQLIVAALAVKRAPVGQEDETGFHAVRHSPEKQKARTQRKWLRWVMGR